MHKIRMQLLEFMAVVTIILFSVAIYFASLANYLGTAIPIFLMIALAIIYPSVEVFISSKRYGHGIWYIRLFNNLELHIGPLTDWNTIAIRVARIRRIALKMNVSVFFYTNHYDKHRLDELAKRLNVAIEIRPANLLQALFYRATCFIVTFYKVEAWKRKKYPVLRCVMNPEKSKLPLNV
ncbi:hypothetical protein Q0V21_30630 [Paenibacillus sp. 11B]|uniref:hypothetical protein n=1 Tax=Paenibacillus sp. 11B TaxID=3060965 RepID=UPI0026541F33|nr:hypothetical protein [Paenibacillus sp. 11B]MDN8593087.1 hypothetical protein [Paenibacillus sp. 11B]